MDDRSRTIGIVYLGAIALLALGLMGACTLYGQPVPASLGAAFGSAVGALAMSITPRGEGR